MMFNDLRRLDRRYAASMCLMGISALLFLAACPAARAADTCESTFKASGSLFSGKVFEARWIAPGVTAQGAVEQMKVIAPGEDFQVGQDTLAGSTAKLALTSKPQGNSRGFPVEFSADDSGQLVLKASLPAGMGASEKNMRASMCGILAKVKPRGVESSVPATATTDARAAQGAPGALPGPISPEDSTRLCEANFTDETDVVGGTRSVFGTWTLTSSGDDAQHAFGRLKAFLAKTSDARMLREDFHGKKGAMDISLTSGAYIRSTIMDAPDVRPFPVRVEFDSDMGAVSLVLRTYSKQQGSRDALRSIACAMLSATAAGTAPSSPNQSEKTPRLRNPFKKVENSAMAKRTDDLKRRNDGMEALFVRAIYAGKAFVAMPTLFVFKKYQGTGVDQLREEQLVNYWIDLTATTQWQRADDAADVLQTGSMSSMTEQGLHGFAYRYPGGSGKSEYGLFIVDPGTYQLKGTSTEFRRASMPDMSTQAGPAKSSLGSVSFVSTQDTEYYKTQAWQGATYQNGTYTGTYCALMDSSTGGCAGFDVGTRSYSKQVSSAGYKTVQLDKQVSGLLVTTALSRPFASFRVGKGDVVYADGFVVDGASIAINHDACKQADADTATCALKSFNVLRVPATAEHVSEWQRSGLIAPSLAGLLGKAKPADITLGAGVVALPQKPGTFEAGWATRYALKSK
ncbi:hypothetical protein [Xanthomonas sp. NCPPB 2632]|uniref:hypothetical protein n=1 Tax=Xanthomonas sp. NCPPB 2632 TaxID=3240912 RepID=UPI003510E54E